MRRWEEAWKSKIGDVWNDGAIPVQGSVKKSARKEADREKRQRNEREDKGEGRAEQNGIEEQGPQKVGQRGEQVTKGAARAVGKGCVVAIKKWKVEEEKIRMPGGEYRRTDETQPS